LKKFSLSNVCERQAKAQSLTTYIHNNYSTWWS